MDSDDTYKVLKQDQIGHCADRYLKIYIANIDWEPHIVTLWGQLSKKGKTPQDLRNVIAATILLPYTDNSVWIDKTHPENLLLKMPYFHQAYDRDWFALFQKTVEEDAIIELKRDSLLALGIISQIKYDPISRQAFNWLYDRAQEDITEAIKQDITERFTNLVMAYGGAAICNIFTRHESKLKKILNWRTGYFFEKVIHEIYTREDLLKIKAADLKRANPDLIRQISYA